MKEDYLYGYYDSENNTHWFKLNNSYIPSPLLWNQLDRCDFNYVYVYEKLQGKGINCYLVDTIYAVFLILLKHINKRIESLSIYPSKNSFCIHINYPDSLVFTISCYEPEIVTLTAIWYSNMESLLEGKFKISDLDFILIGIF